MLTASAFALALFATTAQPAPSLTPLEKAQGFKLYSGPDATSLWHAFKQPSFPAKGWSISDGVFTQSSPSDGDIVTNDQFADFELAFDFKVDPKANSGVMWRVIDKHDATWNTGPEFQVLDDKGYPDGNPAQGVGSLYDLYAAPADKPVKPAGEWNNARIYMRGGVLQHWLNSAKVVEAKLFDDSGAPTKEWTDKITASKFKPYQGFGIQPKGSIALQEHGGGAAFRNIKIRDLAAPAPGEVNLLTTTNATHGKDIEGWECIVPDLSSKGEHPGAPWSVKDGILICSGNPAGYIRTKSTHDNFILKLQWRFSPVTKQAGNSGVLVRITGEDKVWPKSVEAQLHSGNAGDFWNIGDFVMTTDPARTKGRNTKKTHAAERPIGEWNEYEIIVNGPTITLFVNGEQVNQATGVEVLPGHIALQSEGAEIHFKNIRLTPLK